MKTPVPPIPAAPLPETQPTATLPTLPDTSQDDIRTQPTSALETLPLITPAPSDVHELHPVANAPIAAPAPAREPVPPVVLPPPAVRAPGPQAPFAALATALVVGLLGGISLGYVMWGRARAGAGFRHHAVDSTGRIEQRDRSACTGAAAHAGTRCERHDRL